MRHRSSAARLWAAVAISVCLLNAPARGADASEPKLTMAADGRTVTGTIDVGADVAAVLAVFADPHQTARYAGGRMTITPIRDDGACRIMLYTLPNSIAEIQYTGRFCATATGSSVHLVESDQLSEYQQRWSAEDLGGGRVRLRYEVLTEPKLPMPSGIVLAATRREMGITLSTMRASLEG